VMVETGSDIYVKLFQDTVIVIRIMFMHLHLLGISDAVNFYINALLIQGLQLGEVSQTLMLSNT